MSEEIKRSAIKALSWRVIASSSTVLLVYIVTGNLEIAFGVGGLHIVVNTILYFLHERVWNVVKWGTKSSKK